MLERTEPGLPSLEIRLNPSQGLVGVASSSSYVRGEMHLQDWPNAIVWVAISGGVTFAS
jgi:hypothetical protein